MLPFARPVILTLFCATAAFAQTSGRETDSILATVTIPQAVLADGQHLPSGMYQVRLTGDWFQPLEQDGQQGMQWVEVVSGNTVAGRELALVIPATEIQAVSAWHPEPGAARVDALKGGEFVRVWVNRGGTNYLIHLAVPHGGATGGKDR